MKSTIIFILWVVMIILWNFGVPHAEPWQDVAVAIILSLLVNFLKK